MKTLVVYYSYSGNTKVIAEKIAKYLDSDIVELETVVPYSSDYDTVVNIGHDEVNRNYMPEIKPLNKNLDDYKRIIIGTPTWWYKMASPVLTFLSNYDFSNKIIVPFMTNAGWKGTVIKDMTKLCKSAKVELEKEIKFNGNRLITSKDELDQWLEELKKSN